MDRMRVSFSFATVSLGLAAGFVAAAVCLGPAPGVHAADSGGMAFEVASVKPAGPLSRAQERLFEMEADEGIPFLPGRGQRIEIHGMSAAELVAAAYRMPMREVVGPSWISDTRFDVDALIPSGQTRDKAPEMLRTLLEERLALKAHRDVRRTSGYVLSVEKAGPKLKEAGPLTPTADIGGVTGRPKPRFSGYSEQLDHSDMAELANALARDLQAPVEDRTGLKGFYSILIQVPASDMRDELTRPAAFREALKAYGLDLTGGKIDAPILVIDNLSKTPAPN